MIYWGRPERRHEELPIDGRADIIQAETGVRGETASIEVDVAATTATRAASSRSVGVPRTTLSSGSSSIDRAYDRGPAFSGSPVPPSARRFAVPWQGRGFSSL